VFGLGFGEMLLLGVVVLVLFGPKELPKMLRSVGRGLNKLRQMSTDLRRESGIDEIMRAEGLDEDLAELRSLARGGVVDSLMRPAPPARNLPPVAHTATPLAALKAPEGPAPDRAREYPEGGSDDFGAVEDAPPPAVDAKAGDNGAARGDEDAQPRPREAPA
jgi:sec-independent protein translocase protein TatB